MISRKTTVSAAALFLASAGAAAAFPATAVTDLNVRSGPGTGYSVVDTLRDGESVEVVGQSGGWYQLADGGWASGNYLDAESETSVYIDSGYDYGPAAFYYDSDPFYWDDAGFYFYIRDGRRHRIGWDWFNRHDHHNFRWANSRFRGDFERRRGHWDSGDRDARRGSDQDQPRIRSGRASADREADRPSSSEGETRGNFRRAPDASSGNRGDGGDAMSGPRRFEQGIPGGGY